MEVETPQPPEDANDGFELVKRRKRTLEMAKIFHIDENREAPQETPNKVLKNRYAVLENVEEREKENNTAFNTKPKLPPPIVLHQKVKDHKNLVDYLNKVIGKQYYLKHSANRVTIQTYENTKYRALLNDLLTTDLQLHTYTPKDERTHGFVIRGLDSNPDIDDIKQDLEITHKIPIKEIFKMKTNYRPLYLIITPKEITLNFLQENIEFVCRTKVRWQVHKNIKQTVQCKRCQEWGHSTTNCFATPTCAHCAEKHWTHACPDKTKTKCANCAEKHKAYSPECSVYQDRLAMIQKATQPAPVYVDAPAPTKNIWTHEENTEENAPNINTVNFPPLAQRNNRNQAQTARDTVNPVVSAKNDFYQI